MTFVLEGRKSKNTKIQCHRSKTESVHAVFYGAVIAIVTAQNLVSASNAAPNEVPNSVELTTGGVMENQSQTSGILAMQPERKIDAVLLDTLNEAIRSSDAGLLIKFIARNPNHPLANKARQLLKVGNYLPAQKTPFNGVDSKYVEFDKARRQGVDGLRAFMATYPKHPLAAEARRMMNQ